MHGILTTVQSQGIAREPRTGSPDESADPALLPAHPGDWTFLIANDGIRIAETLIPALRDLGFGVAWLDAGASLENPAPGTILLAGAAGLAGRDARPDRPSIGTGMDGMDPLIVAVVDGDDCAVQLGARRAGASLLLDAPLRPDGLLSALAGLAWMPRQPYRILLVEQDPDILQTCADALRAAGCAVATTTDPAEVGALADRFVPETCVTAWSMPGGHGPDLLALLRRDRRFARLPAVYLATRDAAGIAPATRESGDVPIAVTDTSLPTRVAIARARHHRLSERAHAQRGRVRRELIDLRAVLDIHAAVSVSALDGTILEVNAQFCEISGYGREELIGNTHRLIRSCQHPPAFFAEMWRTIADGDIWQGELQNRRKDGHPYWVKCTIAPLLDDRGQPRRYLSIHTEIDDQKRLLAQGRRQARLLELLRQTQQRFLATQEIQAPSALLLEGILELTGSTLGLLGEVLHDAAGAPYLRIHALRDLARRTRGEPAPGLDIHDLDTLIGQVPRTGDTVLDNDVAPGTVTGLPARLSPIRAFLGLPIRYGDTLFGMLALANGPDGYDRGLVDFLQPLATTWADLLEAIRLRQFQQQVIDDLESSRNRALGDLRALRAFLHDWIHEAQQPLNAILGLTELQLLRNSTLVVDARQRLEHIAQDSDRLTRLHDALLTRLEQADGAAAAPAPAPAASVPAAPRSRVLVIDDESASQIMLRMQLELLGAEVDLAADGRTALRLWREHRHDLILTDIRMPGMDGLDLARAIRAAEIHSGRHTPIVAISVLGRAEDRAMCQAAGLDALLAKPIDLDTLRGLLTDYRPRAHNGANPAASGPGDRMLETTLDTDFIARILGDRRHRSLRELLDLFSITARADLAASASWCETGDSQRIAHAMHKLTSAARLVGAHRFAALAEALETRARVERAETLKAPVAALADALDDVETAVLRFFSESVAAERPDAHLHALPDAIPRRVLVVDEDALVRRQVSLLLESLGVDDVMTVDTSRAALEATRRSRPTFDLLITGLSLPEMDGVEFLRQLAADRFAGRIILCSALDVWIRQAAAEMARARGLRLLGGVGKPLTRDILVHLLNTPETLPVCQDAMADLPDITAGEILDGLQGDEFKVYFQPKVDAQTLRPVGLEALARWERAGQAIPTERFIAAADRHGLIGPLSRTLFARALRDGARLIADGFRLTMAFNLAASWLTDVELPEFIADTLRATGFPAELLILEITETGLIADLSTSLDVLTRLRLKGFKLSIDDFGTGYSSMEQLQRIPFGELKIDRSFVREATGTQRSHAILASSIEMARQLKLTIVAEGVETREELDLVRGLGCDLIQGWYIARAMPLPDLLNWLRTESG